MLLKRYTQFSATHSYVLAVSNLGAEIDIGSLGSFVVRPVLLFIHPIWCVVHIGRIPVLSWQRAGWPNSDKSPNGTTAAVGEPAAQQRNDDGALPVPMWQAVQEVEEEGTGRGPCGLPAAPRMSNRAWLACMHAAAFPYHRWPVTLGCRLAEAPRARPGRQSNARATFVA